MSHEHPLVCGACGGELRSATQDRCNHCGALDPLEAQPTHAHPDSWGNREVPRTIAGATPDQLREFLSGNVAAAPKTRKRYLDDEKG